MKTALQAGAIRDAKTERSSIIMSAIRIITSRAAWLYDRFVFHIIYRGERLRPEVQESIEQEIEDEKQGKVKPSPRFTNTRDMMDWLNS